MSKGNLDKLDQKDKLSRSNKVLLTPLYLVIFSKISKKVFIKLSFLPDWYIQLSVNSFQEWTDLIFSLLPYLPEFIEYWKPSLTHSDNLPKDKNHKSDIACHRKSARSQRAFVFCYKRFCTCEHKFILMFTETNTPRHDIIWRISIPSVLSILENCSVIYDEEIHITWPLIDQQNIFFCSTKF